MPVDPLEEARERLEPCPFCGGKAEIVHIEEGENAGGSCVSCTRCLASSNVEFEFKENFVSNWNRRSPPTREGEVETQYSSLRFAPQPALGGKPPLDEPESAAGALIDAALTEPQPQERR